VISFSELVHWDKWANCAHPRLQLALRLAGAVDTGATAHEPCTGLVRPSVRPSNTGGYRSLCTSARGPCGATDDHMCMRACVGRV
jgi:hypothetical protein